MIEGTTVVVNDLESFAKKVARLDQRRGKFVVLYDGKNKDFKVNMTHEQFEQMKGTMMSQDIGKVN